MVTGFNTVKPTGGPAVFIVTPCIQEYSGPHSKSYRLWPTGWRSAETDLCMVGLLLTNVPHQERPEADKDNLEKD